MFGEALTEVFGEAGVYREDNGAIRITHIPFGALEIIGDWCFREVELRINRTILCLPSFRTPAPMRKIMEKRDIKTSSVCASLPSRNDFGDAHGRQQAQQAGRAPEAVLDASLVQQQRQDMVKEYLL